MAQAAYPPPVDALMNDLAATAKSTAREILTAPSLLSSLTIKQRNTLGGLTEGVKHPAAALIQTYVEEFIPAHTAPYGLPRRWRLPYSRVHMPQPATRR